MSHATAHHPNPTLEQQGLASGDTLACFIKGSPGALAANEALAAGQAET